VSGPRASKLVSGSKNEPHDVALEFLAIFLFTSFGLMRVLPQIPQN